METPRRKKQTTENFIKDVRRKTRRIFSSEQKIQIVMEAMRSKLSVSEICRKYSIYRANWCFPLIRKMVCFGFGKISLYC